MTIIGTLTNNGTIIGDVASGAAGSLPAVAGDGLAVIGDYSAGGGASFRMPSADLTVKVAGDFDVAINNNQNYDMVEAELRMIGLGEVAQGLEVMSEDIGPDPAGLDRTQPGHYPVGTLRIGPTPTVVNVVDNHDNDGLGQQLCEAVYVGQLVIEAGATLNTLGCSVYYSTLTLDGTVDDPGNLIALPPPCPCDCEPDPNGAVGVVDFLTLLAQWGGPGSCDCADPPDGVVNVFDFLFMLGTWGPCP